MKWDEDKKFTRLTVEQSNKKIIWEVPYEDVSGDDMMQAINTLMIGMTFHPDTVLYSMAGFLEEYGHNLYDVYEHQEEDEPINEDN
ncbi:MAG: hypothetical protein IJH39_05855 [Clostridia bacterium]|nr:hypothetical protein [Clostridia bacterium]